MNKLQILTDALNARESQLIKIIKEKNPALSKAPSGYLKISPHRNTYQYYHKKDKTDYNGKYIKKKDRIQAVQLAQKEYDSMVLSTAQAELKHIEILKDIYNNKACEDVISQIHPAKAALVKPIRLSDEQFIANWLCQEYVTNHSHPEHLLFESNKGIKMRSKSEVIIANLLDSMNIPYIYEKELSFDLFNSVYPDFTILDVKNRQEVYLEHLGMMDNIDYVTHTMQKISKYEENGYVLGQELLITYETTQLPLNISLVKEKLAKFAY